MLELGCIRALDITQRRIVLHDALLNQMSQAEQVFVLAQSIEISSSERQRAKVLVDCVEK